MVPAPATKRDHEQVINSKDDPYDVGDDYVPYVPVKKRREQQLEKLAGGRHAVALTRPRGDEEEEEEDEDEVERRRRERESRTLLSEAQDTKRQKAEEEAHKTEEQKRQEEEEAALKALSAAQKRLAGAKEIAMGVTYTEPLKTSWKPPRYIESRSHQENEKIRSKLHIKAECEEGDIVPPPIDNFAEMKVPEPLIEYFRSKNIKTPSAIQAQGIPIAFSGRDMIGVAYTGSGKTLAFSLPLLMFSIEEESKLEFTSGEGPVGIILCPSRELARQTYDSLIAMAEVMTRAGYPTVSTLLCIGGISMGEQSHTLRKGFHMVVATPGRLQDMLAKKKFNLNLCKYLCLDEADRMIDMGFEDDVRNILSFFTRQRQTLLFSATMPPKIRDFARQSLIKPLLLNVGRAGAANLKVIQEVEYVKQEAKMVYLLECLQKTPPPVIIFSDNKNEVDDIQEYLLLKGVEAVAIHGSKTQEEREYAIRSFKEGKKDVMVASGVASKGLDFPDIQHVINFTMPKEIEDYVHQIGRTGRSGNTGIATTFVNMNVPEETLLSLKYLLIEAKQRVPQFIATIQDPDANTDPTKPCPICGTLGHTILRCPRHLENQRKQMAQHMSRNRDTGGY